MDLMIHRKGSPPGCGLVSLSLYELATKERDSQKVMKQKGSKRTIVPIRLTHVLFFSEK